MATPLPWRDKMVWLSTATVLGEARPCRLLDPLLDAVVFEPAAAGGVKSDRAGVDPRARTGVGAGEGEG